MAVAARSSERTWVIPAASCPPPGSGQGVVLAQTSTLKGGGYAFRRRPVDVRFGSEADICNANRRVRFSPKSGHVPCGLKCPLWAIADMCDANGNVQ
jgi:hypothetical protein